MTIADSDAFRDDARVLSQHQAALTLLQDRLANPNLRSLPWLDLACGRGQIIGRLERILAQAHRSKTGEMIRSLLARKLEKCREALEALTVHGPETPEEQSQKERYLFDHWALSRALGTVE